MSSAATTKSLELVLCDTFSSIAYYSLLQSLRSCCGAGGLGLLLLLFLKLCFKLSLLVFEFDGLLLDYQILVDRVSLNLDFHASCHPLQFLILLIKAACVLIVEQELKRKVVVVEVVDEVPEDVLVELPDLVHLELHVLALKKHHFYPLVELLRAYEHRSLLKVTPGMVKKSLADHHLELWGANLLPAVGAESLNVFRVGTSALCFLLHLMEVLNSFP